MNIPSHFRSLVFVLLSAFFAVLIAGCGGHTLAVYDPINESRSDLVSAKTSCNAQAIRQIAPLKAQQEAKAAQREAQLAGMKALAKLTGGSGGSWMTPEINQEFQNIARGNAEKRKLAGQQQDFFCSCMVERGWQCAGTLKFRDINAPIPQADTGQTPLHVAALHDNVDSVSWLVSKGANVNVPADDGSTPLHWTTVKDAAEAAKALLWHGADVNARTDDGVPPLQAAAGGNSRKVAALLAERGADIHTVSDDDWTSLHTAARYNSREVAGLLIAEGADIEAQGGDEGLTPLHRAAFYGHVETVDLLIARGANLNAKTYAGETPLDLAKREGKRDVIALLERAARVAARKTEGESNSVDDAGDAESVFENAWRSVVVVVAGDSQGGGVVVNEPNQVATNCHVVDESPIDIRVYKGENRRAVRDAPYAAEIVSGDRERDVCILSVPGLWAIPAKIRTVAELEIGEAVYAVGTPKGLDFSISNGIVSQLREEDGENAPLIQTDAAISPGSSGGGLFDSRGRLVGLTTWGIREGENLNFAVPVDWVLELVR